MSHRNESVAARPESPPRDHEQDDRAIAESLVADLAEAERQGNPWRAAKLRNRLDVILSGRRPAGGGDQ